MTMSTQSCVVTYAGNGELTEFPYNFKIFNDTDLKGVVRDADGNETPLAAGTDFTVSGAGDSQGGSVTYPVSGAPLPEGASLTLHRELDFTQTLELVENDPFPAKLMEQEFDKAVMRDQQIKERIDRVPAYSVAAPTEERLSCEEYVNAVQTAKSDAESASDETETARAKASNAAARADVHAAEAAAQSDRAEAAAVNAESLGGWWSALSVNAAPSGDASFNVPGNLETIFTVGRALKLTDSSNKTVCGYVSVAEYNGSDATAVSVTCSVPADLQSVDYGQAANNTPRPGPAAMMPEVTGPASGNEKTGVDFSVVRIDGSEYTDEAKFFLKAIRNSDGTDISATFTLSKVDASTFRLTLPDVDMDTPAVLRFRATEGVLGCSEWSVPMPFTTKHVTMTADNAAVFNSIEADWPIQNTDTACSKTVQQEKGEADWTNLSAQVGIDATAANLQLSAIDSYNSGTLQCSDARSGLTGPWGMFAVGSDTGVVVTDDPTESIDTSTFTITTLNDLDYNQADGGGASSLTVPAIGTIEISGTNDACAIDCVYESEFKAKCHINSSSVTGNSIWYFAVGPESDRHLVGSNGYTPLVSANNSFKVHKEGPSTHLKQPNNTIDKTISVTTETWWIERTSDGTINVYQTTENNLVHTFTEKLIGNAMIWFGNYNAYSSSGTRGEQIGVVTAGAAYTWTGLDKAPISLASVGKVFKLPDCCVGTGGDVSVQQAGESFGVVGPADITSSATVTDSNITYNSGSLADLLNGNTGTTDYITYNNPVGAQFKFHFSEAKTIADIGLYYLAAGDAESWKVRYSDNGGTTWTNAGAILEPSHIKGWNNSGDCSAAGSHADWCLECTVQVNGYYWCELRIREARALTDLVVTHPDSGFISVGTDLVLNGSRTVDVTEVSESGSGPYTYTCTINPAATSTVTSAAKAGTPLKVKELIVPETALTVVEKNGTALTVNYPTPLTGLFNVDQHDTVKVNGSTAVGIESVGVESDIVLNLVQYLENYSTTTAHSTSRTYLGGKILPNSVTLTKIGVSQGDSKSGTVGVWRLDSGTTYTLVASVSGTIGGNATEPTLLTLGTPYEVPSSGTYRIGLATSAPFECCSTASSGAHGFVISGVQTGTQTFSDDSTNDMAVGYETGEPGKRTTLTLATDPGAVTTAVVPSRFPASAEVPESVVRSDLTISEETHDKLTITHSLRSITPEARSTAIAVSRSDSETDQTCEATINLYTGA